MAERPILFSGEMVRAILAGKKTQTRRLVSPKSFAGKWLDGCDPGETESRSEASIGARAYVADPGNYPPYVVGDRLWVRETWAGADDMAGIGSDCDGPPQCVAYRADKTARIVSPTSDGQPSAAADTYAWNWDMLKWRPSIHMPRWASRITLEVTAVRVERLQDISEEDAEAEGVDGSGPVGNMRVWSEMGRHRYQFAGLWDAINGKRCPWDSNPWVWVVEFRRV